MKKTNKQIAEHKKMINQIFKENKGPEKTACEIARYWLCHGFFDLGKYMEIRELLGFK